ncbi:hypothetical protein GDO86_008721 [Hymenochirus boettgeri]|uniref:Plakophilin 3 n=1 Tax=Hymenochirus boettgeri TaxID=247094 RepID=A0A8T2J6U9_9PIPI|nr:hypothetical protein GDO86_008721 [Hymenochirus boettgeri]
MQDNNFLMSALQPYTEITSLALPTDSQLDRRMREESMAQRNARVQEQVRTRMMQKSQTAPRVSSGSYSTYGESYSSRAQYGTAPVSYSSRSQILGNDQRISTIRPSGYSTGGGIRSGFSSRSAVDVGGTQRISVASQQRGYSTTRPTSYHEKVYPTRREYDTMSLRSMQIGDGEERYNQGTGSQSYYGRQMSSTSAAPSLQRSLSGNIAQNGDGSSWVERAEVAQTRTIRAPAMRTLQRFQSNNRARDRVGSSSYGTMNATTQQQVQQTVTGIGSSYVSNVVQQTSRAPSVRSLAESGHQMQETRGIDVFGGNKSLMSQHSFVSGFDDIDMPLAVQYLMAPDPNLQVLGAAFIQHRCYSDSDAKKQARELKAIPKLINLFNCNNQEVQRHATGAMRNLIYDNADNKMTLVEENGIYELLTALKEPDDELRKNVTGILWNLSSSDNLKTRLARDTLIPLTNQVLSPLSGSAGSAVIQQNASEGEIFYNATGFLSWAAVLSQVALDQERIINPVLDCLRTADPSQLRSLTGLLRNLSRHTRNKEEMSTKVVSHLLEKLPEDGVQKSPPADVLVNIIAVLNNLTVAGPLAARDIVYFNGLSKLMYIKRNKDNSECEKASRAASSLLTNMWQYNKLHRDYKAKGYRKEDFLSP